MQEKETRYYCLPPYKGKVIIIISTVKLEQQINGLQ